MDRRRPRVIGRRVTWTASFGCVPSGSGLARTRVPGSSGKPRSTPPPVGGRRRLPRRSRWSRALQVEGLYWPIPCLRRRWRRSRPGRRPASLSVWDVVTSPTTQTSSRPGRSSTRPNGPVSSTLSRAGRVPEAPLSPGEGAVHARVAAEAASPPPSPPQTTPMTPTATGSAAGGSGTSRALEPAAHDRSHEWSRAVVLPAAVSLAEGLTGTEWCSNMSSHF